ncbi:MAG TPA: DUF4097 family beta strand repeat-containing protein [Terracidiphilus sp.]|nr:DUF4097 family beta strand repeat-containing protein [Terracidiphilus sp.]
MSTPPNMPPGGGTPPPPYDPKMQWRAYREQQRAAWRAQRDAWRAQRHAWKANYAGAYGPRVPSVVGPVILICVGVIALLLATGHIDAGSFWDWYGRWWPLLLIAAGLALLAEWAMDMRRETPVRRGGSFVGILFLLAFLGLCAAGWHHMGPFFGGWNGNNDFFNFWGMPEHDLDQQALNATIPANGSIVIQNPRGDVSITAADQPNVQVQAHEMAYADTDSEASKVFDSEAAHITVSGASVIVKSNGNDHGRVNLTVTVPRTAKVEVSAGKGDVTASGLGAGIDVTAGHGDTHLDDVTGSVTMHLSNDKHDFSAHQINGDITANGDINDVTLSEVQGRISLNGDIYGEAHIENASAQVGLHTSRTDVQIGALHGDMTMDSDSLRVTDAKGPVHVTTRSKDIDLSEIYGDIVVQGSNGTISVAPAGSYSVDAKNDKGDIELTLPPDASATLDGQTHNGDIVSDYELTISGDENKTVNGKIGSGAAHIQLNTSNGDLHIKKGAAFPATPPAAPKAPNAPAANAPHLKSNKTLPQQPVTQ